MNLTDRKKLIIKSIIFGFTLTILLTMMIFGIVLSVSASNSNKAINVNKNQKLGIDEATKNMTQITSRLNLLSRNGDICVQHKDNRTSMFAANHNFIIDSSEIEYFIICDSLPNGTKVDNVLAKQCFVKGNDPFNDLTETIFTDLIPLLFNTDISSQNKLQSVLLSIFSVFGPMLAVILGNIFGVKNCYDSIMKDKDKKQPSKIVKNNSSDSEVSFNNCVFNIKTDEKRERTNTGTDKQMVGFDKSQLKLINDRFEDFKANQYLNSTTPRSKASMSSETYKTKGVVNNQKRLNIKITEQCQNDKIAEHKESYT